VSVSDGRTGVLLVSRSVDLLATTTEGRPLFYCPLATNNNPFAGFVGEVSPGEVTSRVAGTASLSRKLQVDKYTNS